MVTAGWASATRSHRRLSHPPPRGSRKLAAPTVAASAPLPGHLLSQDRSGRQVLTETILCRLGGLCPSLPFSRGTVRGTVGWVPPHLPTARCHGHSTHHRVARSPECTPTRERDPCLCPSAGGSLATGPLPAKVCCCPRNTVIPVSWGDPTQSKQGEEPLWVETATAFQWVAEAPRAES